MTGSNNIVLKRGQVLIRPTKSILLVVLEVYGNYALMQEYCLPGDSSILSKQHVGHPAFKTQALSSMEFLTSLDSNMVHTNQFNTLASRLDAKFNDIDYCVDENYFDSFTVKKVFNETD